MKDRNLHVTWRNGRLDTVAVRDHGSQIMYTAEVSALSQPQIQAIWLSVFDDTTGSVGAKFFVSGVEDLDELLRRGAEWIEEHEELRPTWRALLSALETWLGRPIDVG